MTMKNPMHPGEFIIGTYMQPMGISIREAARHLDVAPSTFARILGKSSNVSPDMAYRLSITFGRSPESWLAMQNSYDLAHMKKQKLRKVKKLEIADVA